MSSIIAYCTSDDVERALPRVLGRARSANVNLSADMVTEFCKSISAEMDSRFVAVGYKVPITTSNERIQKNLERIAINGVCAQVLRSVYQTGDVNFDLADTYERQYYRDISLIERNGFGETVPRITDSSLSSAPSIGPDYCPTFRLDSTDRKPTGAGFSESRRI